MPTRTCQSSHQVERHLGPSHIHQPLPLFLDRAFAREKLEAAEMGFKKRRKRSAHDEEAQKRQLNNMH
jgi:hypothetical protein